MSVDNPTVHSRSVEGDSFQWIKLSKIDKTKIANFRPGASAVEEFALLRRYMVANYYVVVWTNISSIWDFLAFWSMSIVLSSGFPVLARPRLRRVCRYIVFQLLTRKMRSKPLTSTESFFSTTRELRWERLMKCIIRSPCVVLRTIGVGFDDTHATRNNPPACRLG